jgi:sugar phosphate isomerase/epimerase
MRIPHDAGRIDRRAFLAKAAYVGVGGFTMTACAPGTSALEGSRRLDRIGVQLYTVRDRMREDVPTTLATVAEIGYREVETAGLFDLTPQGFRAELDRAGLVSPAGHYSLNALRGDAESILTTAETLGQRWVIVPSLDQRERTLEGYRNVAAEFNRMGAQLQQRGLRFGYHNHDFEFQPLEGGRTGYEILLTETDPDLVDMELDLYWAIRGGDDPIRMMQRHPGRFRLLHVKDMADPTGTPRMTDVGGGDVDFASIFAAGERAGVQHHFVEHDNPDDSVASIRASFSYLRELRY